MVWYVIYLIYDLFFGIFILIFELGDIIEVLGLCVDDNISYFDGVKLYFDFVGCVWYFGDKSCVNIGVYKFIWNFF